MRHELVPATGNYWLRQGLFSVKENNLLHNLFVTGNFYYDINFIAVTGFFLFWPKISCCGNKLISTHSSFTFCDNVPNKYFLFLCHDQRCPEDPTLLWSLYTVSEFHKKCYFSTINFLAKKLIWSQKCWIYSFYSFDFCKWINKELSQKSYLKR